MALRAINVDGTATTGIRVGGVLWGDADAGYTDFATAYTASSDGDRIAYTGAITEPAGLFTVAKNLDIARADNVALGAAIWRGDTTLALLSRPPVSGYIRYYGLNIKGGADGKCAQLDSQPGNLLMRCLLEVTSTTAHYLVQTASTGAISTLEECVFLLPEGTNWLRAINGTANGNYICRNCIALVLGTGSTTLAAFGTQSGSITGCKATNCKALKAGVGVQNGGAFQSTVEVEDTGANMSWDATAPGSVNHRNIAATDVMVDPANGNYHWKDRDTMLAYTAADILASLYEKRDIDNELVTENHVGADYVAALAAATNGSGGLRLDLSLRL